MRGCIEQPYIVLFKVEGNIVKVYRVLDGRSDYLARLGLKENVNDVDDE